LMRPIIRQSRCKDEAPGHYTNPGNNSNNNKHTKHLGHFHQSYIRSSTQPP
jgi:hypothetical protein